LHQKNSLKNNYFFYQIYVKTSCCIVKLFKSYPHSYKHLWKKFFIIKKTFKNRTFYNNFIVDKNVIKLKISIYFYHIKTIYCIYGFCL